MSYFSYNDTHLTLSLANIFLQMSSCMKINFDDIYHLQPTWVTSQVAPGSSAEMKDHIISNSDY